jgi:hypothetical protein
MIYFAHALVIICTTICSTVILLAIPNPPLWTYIAGFLMVIIYPLIIQFPVPVEFLPNNEVSNEPK